MWHAALNPRMRTFQRIQLVSNVILHYWRLAYNFRCTARHHDRQTRLPVIIDERDPSLPYMLLNAISRKAQLQLHQSSLTGLTLFLPSHLAETTHLCCAFPVLNALHSISGSSPRHFFTLTAQPRFGASKPANSLLRIGCSGVMAPKQATLGYVKPAQQTLGCADSEYLVL